MAPGYWRASSCRKLPQRPCRRTIWDGLIFRGRGTMDFLGGLSFWGTGWTGWVIPFLFVLSIVVFFHELGHFLVARWCGIRVLTFSVGFGPELAGFYDRH